MSVLTKKEIMNEMKNSSKEILFCAFCYETLVATKEGFLFCPNEMCLNQRTYTKEGKEVMMGWL